MDGDAEEYDDDAFLYGDEAPKPSTFVFLLISLLGTGRADFLPSSLRVLLCSLDPLLPQLRV